MSWWSKKSSAPLHGHSAPPETGSFINAFINAELLMALEKLGLFEYISARKEFSIRETARDLKLRADLLLAACGLLAEARVLTKIGTDTFRLAVDYAGNLEAQNNYLLAYKPVYNSLAELLSGTKSYGKDVVRDATRLGFGTRRSIPFLVKRFRELGITTALDIGCGRGNFLFALAEAIPGFRGIGIEIDKATVAFAQERIAASPYRESLKVFEGDAAHPERFPAEACNVDAFYGVAIFHELGKSGDLASVFRDYKRCLPRSKFFLIEFDTPGWNAVLEEPPAPLRQMAAQYLLTHYFTEQGLPRPKREWKDILERSGWQFRVMHDLPLRLTAFECD